MEGNTEPKTKANGMILAILLVATLVILLMWVMIVNMRDEEMSLRSQIDSLNREKATLKQQVVLFESKVSEEIVKEVEEEMEKEKEKEDEKDDSKKTTNEVSNEVSNEAVVNNTTVENKAN